MPFDSFKQHHLERHKHFRIDGNVLIPNKSLGIPRSQMPQIKSSDVQDFFAFLEKEFGYKTKTVKVKAEDLTPTQKEVNLDKCRAMLDNGEAFKKPGIASQDGFVLDGHHRVFAHVLDTSNKAFDIYQIQAPILDILKAAHHYPKVFYKNINEAQGALMAESAEVGKPARPFPKQKAKS